MAWLVEYMNENVEAEFLALPTDVQASLLRVASLIENYGLEQVGMPYVRHVEGKIWEMRGRGKDGIARSLYVTQKVQRIIVLRVFVKKTPATPRSEIKLALKRLKEIDNG